MGGWGVDTTIGPRKCHFCTWNLDFLKCLYLTMDWSRLKPKGALQRGDWPGLCEYGEKEWEGMRGKWNEIIWD